MRRLRAILVVLVALAASAHADDKRRFQIDEKASEIKLFVKKRGALKRFAHDHDVAATVFTGSVVWDAAAPTKGSVEIEIATKELKVLDPHLDADDRASVRKTMLSDEVLDASKYPSIVFRSTSVSPGTRTSDGKQPLSVPGWLSLHGKSNPVTLEVTLVERDGQLEVTGQYSLKQSDFGIEPYSTALGAVGVQDEITVTFKILARR